MLNENWDAGQENGGILTNQTGVVKVASTFQAQEY
jgi:hypothetical protein